jgi:hypothetical protein
MEGILEMFMTYRNVIAATIAVAVCILAGSNAMAQRHGGFGGGGFRGGGFSGGGFHGGGFHGGGFRGGGFRSGSGSARVMPGFGRSGSRFGSGMSRNIRGDRDRRHDGRTHDRFVLFGDFGDPFYYYPYGYYADGYYPYGYYSSGYNPYGYGYDSYDQPVYQGSAGYGDSLIGQVQLRLAHAGYYRGAIDGVSGNATRSAIRKYERAHSLPADGQIRGRLLTSMGLG